MNIYIDCEFNGFGGELRASFRDFMTEFYSPTIVSDWYTDLHHFLSMFQGRDHTESFNYSCNLVLDMNLSSGASAVPHNALHDARAIKEAANA